MLLQFGQNLKRLRRLSGLTQERMAVRAGITSKFISEMENGGRNPSLETLHKIALALNVDISELVSFSDIEDCKYTAMIHQILKDRDEMSLHKIFQVMQIVFDEAH